MAVVGYCVLTALWLISLAGVSLLGFAVIGVFVFTLKTPASVRAAPQPATARPARNIYVQPERRAS
jgi:hypothetical protein